MSATVIHFPTKDPLICEWCGKKTWRLWEHDDCDTPHCWDCLDRHIHPEAYPKEPA